MNILVCPDKFKDCLSAPAAGNCIAKGVIRARSDAVVQVIPMADGGEGTLEAMLAAMNGTLVEVTVNDPLMRKIRARYIISGDGGTAVIEMAAASGLTLLQAGERDPMRASTFGTGELIADALNRQCRWIILGIGGSATVDGGTGMASALGAVFSDSNGKTLEPGGGSLHRLSNINLSGLHKGLERCTIEAACDVTNPLTGPSGAAMIYGPQKGASAEEITILDRNLGHLAAQIDRWLKLKVENLPGAGAAGGVGAGIVSFLRGNLRPGVELISEAVGLKQWIAWADLVITGEGRMDRQTSFGKTPAGVAAMCREAGKPVVAFTGALHDPDALSEIGSMVVMPIADRPMLKDESLARGCELLDRAGERLIRLVCLVDVK